MFSIIIPTYNRAHLISKAIDSVISQTFQDWELIVVDDGSTDETQELIATYQEKDIRIRYIFQENAERSAARNNGIIHAQKKYICFLDSDDYYLPNKLQNLKQQIKKEGDDSTILYDGLILEENGKRTELPFPTQGELSLPDFIISNNLFSQQICANREVFEKYCYNPKIRIGEDTELWLRMTRDYNFRPVVRSFQTIICDHDERSINLKKRNVAREQLKTLRTTFSSDQGKKVSQKVRREVLSNCLFNIAKYHLYQKKKLCALNYLILSILKNFRNPQTRHRLYCIQSLLKLQIPSEYKL